MPPCAAARSEIQHIDDVVANFSQEFLSGRCSWPIAKGPLYLRTCTACNPSRKDRYEAGSAPLPLTSFERAILRNCRLRLLDAAFDLLVPAFLLLIQSLRTGKEGSFSESWF